MVGGAGNSSATEGFACTPPGSRPGPMPSMGASTSRALPTHSVPEPAPLPPKACGAFPGQKQKSSCWGAGVTRRPALPADLDPQRRRPSPLCHGQSAPLGDTQSPRRQDGSSGVKARALPAGAPHRAQAGALLQVALQLGLGLHPHRLQGEGREASRRRRRGQGCGERAERVGELRRQGPPGRPTARPGDTPDAPTLPGLAQCSPGILPLPSPRCRFRSPELSGHLARGVPAPRPAPLSRVRPARTRIDLHSGWAGG